MDFYCTRQSEHHPQWHEGHSDPLAWLCSEQNQRFLLYKVEAMISTLLVSRLPGVTQDLATVRRVSLHVTRERQGARHECDTVAKVIICGIQLELPLLGKTSTIKKKTKKTCSPSLHKNRWLCGGKKRQNLASGSIEMRQNESVQFLPLPTMVTCVPPLMLPLRGQMYRTLWAPEVKMNIWLKHLHKHNKG